MVTNSDIEIWFKSQPKWLQEAALIILENDRISEDQFKELLEICKKEGKGDSDLKTRNIPKGKLSFPNNNVSINIKEIKDVKGVNALNPRKPLCFGNSNLVIVYGENGTGKSGYIRILKKICGARIIDTLHPNVFTKGDGEQKCSVTIRDNDAESTIDFDLTKEIPVTKLMSSDIFDASIASNYILNDNEASYEPYILKLFSYLANVCDKVQKSIDVEIKSITPQKLTVPASIANSPAAIEYVNLSKSSDLKKIENVYQWNDNIRAELASKEKILAENKPSERIEAYTKINQKLTDLRAEIISIKKFYNRENTTKVCNARINLEEKKSALVKAAMALDRKCPLPVGDPIWFQLWNAAKKYSAEIAYKEKEYPHLEVEAKCVLCQQELSSIARDRLTSINEYVKSSFSSEVSVAENALSNLINSLQKIKNDEELATLLIAVQIKDDESKLIYQLYNTARNIYNELLTSKDISKMPLLPDVNNIITLCDNKVGSNNKEIGQLKTIEQDEARSKTIELVRNLRGQQWLNDNIKTVEKEISLIKERAKLETSKKLASTLQLTNKKKELAQVLITEEYIRRFNEELDNLGAKNIRVEIDEKTKGSYGKILHRIKLVGCVNDAITPIDILSEGEFRIVSIAAFLADSFNRNKNTPFIFDDPISSLDMKYERAVAKRLVELSKERQVIVFTHRLSLIGMINSKAKEEDINVDHIELVNETWGAGEPAPVSSRARNVKTLFTTLLRDDMHKARKAYDAEGRNSYEIHMGLICKELRKGLERIVEEVLINEVVSRDSGEIQTKNKLMQLTAIEGSDCRFLNKLFTEYSYDEHSQSRERVSSYVPPEKLEADLTGILAWIEEFTKRRDSIK